MHNEGHSVRPTYFAAKIIVATTHRRSADQVQRLKDFAYFTWRRLRHLGGDFRQGESSPRALNLTTLWASRWPGGEPSGPSLRPLYADCWVRFHLESEPGRRWPSGDVDEGVDRYKAVLADLLAGSRSKQLVVIGEDWEAEGWTRSKMPGSWPWRYFVDPDEYEPGDREAGSYFWVSPVQTVDALEPYFRLIENDEIRVTVTDAEMTWVFAPYDRGIDVFLPDSVSRDRLKNKHGEWLSPRPDGL